MSPNRETRRAAERAARRGGARHLLDGLAAGRARPVPFAVDAWPGRVDLRLTINGHPEITAITPDQADQLAELLRKAAAIARATGPKGVA